MSAFIQKHSVYVTALLCVVTFSGCKDGDFYEIRDEYGNVADSRTLSAGISTVYQSGVTAYDTPAGWVTGNLNTRFYRGDALYDNPRVSGDDPRRAAKGRFMPVRRAESLPFECRTNLSDALFGRRHRQRGLLVAPDLHYEEKRRLFPQLRSCAARSGDHRRRTGGETFRFVHRGDLRFSRRGEVFADYAFLFRFGLVCRQHRSAGSDRRRPHSAAPCRHGADDGA